MTFHLFGVTPEQAEAIQAKYGHTWVACDKQECGALVEAVFLFRGEEGSALGACACEEHEGEMLAIMTGANGCRGVQAIQVTDGSALTDASR